MSRREIARSDVDGHHRAKVESVPLAASKRKLWKVCAANGQCALGLARSSTVALARQGGMIILAYRAFGLWKYAWRKCRVQHGNLQEIVLCDTSVVASI